MCSYLNEHVVLLGCIPAQSLLNCTAGDWDTNVRGLICVKVNVPHMGPVFVVASHLSYDRSVQCRNVADIAAYIEYVSRVTVRLIEFNQELIANVHVFSFLCFFLPRNLVETHGDGIRVVVAGDLNIYQGGDAILCALIHECAHSPLCPSEGVFSRCTQTIRKNLWFNTVVCVFYWLDRWRQYLSANNTQGTAPCASTTRCIYNISMLLLVQRTHGSTTPRDLRSQTCLNLVLY
jgi:hypothetical protein